MKHHWIEYTAEWTPGPMTFWVHIAAEGDSPRLNPPAPEPIPERGYPVYYVEVDGFTFQFASLDELRVCIDTLGKKLLPNTLRDAKKRGGNPDQHWLRKMPDETKPWRYREKAVKYLTKALADWQ
jgi:hypothetical protein